MLQLFTSITCLLLALNQIVLVRRVKIQHKAISEIMELLIQKWSAEMQMGQALMEKYVDESLEQLFRKEQD